MDLEVAGFMLDKKQGTVVDATGHVTYYLGQVEHHSIVIAHIPLEWPMKLSPATLLLAFPNICISLMVGIGGGAPRTGHDVRLGDVVTSLSIEEDSQEGLSVLRDAARVLERHQAPWGLGAYIKTQLTDILERLPPHKRETYSRPPTASDKLYKPEFTHRGPPQSCTACGDDPDTLVERTVRVNEENESIIHHGRIHISDTVIKTAQVRDALAAQEGVSCFMLDTLDPEAFPCLIVVGICDYADTHKSRVWQGHATMVAAVYAKELLSVIWPAIIEKMDPMSRAEGKYPFREFMMMCGDELQSKKGYMLTGIMLDPPEESGRRSGSRIVHCVCISQRTMS